MEGGQSRKYRFGRYLKEVVAGTIRIDEIINEKLTQTGGQRAKDRTVDSNERPEESQERAMLGEKQVINRV